MSRFVAAVLLCAAASAQIPQGHLIYVHRVPSATVAAMGIIDPDNVTQTPLVPLNGIWTTHGSRTVAIDPATPDTLYSITALSISIVGTVPVLTLTGNRFARTNMSVNLGSPGSPYRLRWAPGFGLLLMGRGGQLNRMFLRNMSTGTITSQPTPALLPNDASDLVFHNGKAFATSEGNGTSPVGTVVEWDLATNVDRLVGNTYPPLTALNAFGGQLIAGDSNGDLHLIDPVTGSTSLFLSLGSGAIRSIAVDAASQVFVVIENAGTWSVLSAFNPGTILHSSTTAIDDLEIGPSPAPTMLTYGDGCVGSNSQVPTLGFTGAPAMGTTYDVTLDGALANTGTFLVLGSSRTADPGGPLPRDLGPLGMPGCTQYIDVIATLFGVTGNNGSAQQSFTLPNNPAFAGVQIPLQWLCLDLNANAFGATTSSGGEAYVY